MYVVVVGFRTGDRLGRRTCRGHRGYVNCERTWPRFTMTRKRQTDKNQRQDSPDLQIPRGEQLRLVEQSGILEKVPTSDHEPMPSSAPRTSQEKDEEEEYPLAEEIFAAMTLLIPMSFLLLMMYM
jgi:hypothetical protein